MESLKIEIINPKAKKLLEDLADLNLITISKLDLNLDKILNTLRAEDDITLDEIPEEVESVRDNNGTGEWNKVTKEQQQGIFDAIESIKQGKGIPHEQVMAKMRKMVASGN